VDQSQFFEDTGKINGFSMNEIEEHMNFGVLAKQANQEDRKNN
jgi:hypothetical protein